MGADGLSALHRPVAHCTATAGGWPGTTGAEPVIRKSPLRADSEPEYDKLARQPLGDLGLRAPALGDSRPCRQRRTTPTRSGTASTCWRTTAPSTRRTGSARCCRRTWERQLAGTTDSERYFLRSCGGWPRSGGDMVAAIATRRRRHRAPVRRQQPERDPADARHAVRDLLARPLQGAGGQAADARARTGRDEIAAYFDLAYQADCRRGRGRELRVAAAGLDATAQPACARR